ncbi:MAG: hypothetical protein KGQ88_07120, partial [Chloroflexi bacterium]|nr:hypothetical protein [Chloroflexota bacterium]
MNENEMDHMNDHPPTSSTEPSAPAPAPAFPPAPRTAPRRSSPWSELGRLVAAVAIGAIVGASVMGAAGRGGISLPSPAVAVLGQTSRASQNSNAATAAIKAVIQKANDEQAQAIANNDPSVMRDTATTSHYQDLVQTNEQLTSAGITSIKLVNLRWGTISVSGSNAKATTYETWQSTFSDGSTDRSTDQNDYTLVLQNGKWVVSGDDQPGQSGTGSTQPTAPDPNIAPISPGRNTSSNWSGYAATGGTFTSVTGTWTVPDPKASTAGADATWVGIGGVTSHDLIQAGTEATITGSGSARYDAWIELLPRSQQIVPLTVSPGDSVTVTITQQQGSDWLVSLKDTTTGRDYSTTVTYASTNSSAEWVEEAPSGGPRILPLDDFGSVRFTDATATANGKTLTIAQANGQALTMINAARQPLAQPSALGSDGASFTVTRTAASSNVLPSRGFGRGGFGDGG